MLLTAFSAIKIISIVLISYHIVLLSYHNDSGFIISSVKSPKLLTDIISVYRSGKTSVDSLLARTATALCV